MKPLKLLVIVFLVVFALPAFSATREVTICDVDLSSEANPFRWENLHPALAILPDDGAENHAYITVLKLYEEQLTQEEIQLDYVKKFIEMLRLVAAGEKSGNLAIRVDAEDESFNAVFSGNEDMVHIICAGLSKETTRDIGYVVSSIKKIHDTTWNKLQLHASEHIRNLSLRYDQWVRNGLPMWPLETWANGKRLKASDAGVPPLTQLVLIRPSVGVGASLAGDISRDFSPKGSLALELIGFALYTKNDYSDYWGLSAVVTTGEEDGFGYGVIFRKNQYLLGLTFRQEDKERGIESDKGYLFISLDLLHLLEDKHKYMNDFRESAAKRVMGLVPK